MEVKSSLDPRVIKPFCNLPGSTSMGDVSASRPSNVRPRPLGEVKAESVYFDSPSASVLCVDNYERRLLQENRMDRMHENLITTAIIGDVAAANSAHLARKTPTAHGIPGSSLSSMQLISTLVSPISRTISIPKQRDDATNRGILRINTAPSGFSKDKSMNDPCPSPVSSESGLTDTTMSSGRGGKQTSTWGEYKRRISTAKRKEMCRRMTELSKCEAEDMSDLMSRGSSRRPIMILSQMPQREKEYDQLVAKADVELQKKKTLPSVFLTKQKRPGSLVRETNVFSKALKNKPEYPVGEMEDMVLGRSVDPHYTDRQDEMGSGDSPNSEFGGRRSSAGTRRSFSEMTNPRSGVAFYDVNNVRLGGRHIPPKVSQSSPSASRYRDKVLKLQGKSLPQVHTSRSENFAGSDPAPSEKSTSPQHPHDAKILRELNAKCDRLQKQISVSLMAPDKVWSQNGYFNTNQPAPLTGPVIRQRRQPIHAIYRSFQRMNESKPKDTRRYVPKHSTGCGNTETKKTSSDISDSVNAEEVPPDLPDTVDDENNNNVATKTFHLTEIDDADFLDSDSEEQISLSDSEDGDAPPPALLNPGEIDPIKYPSGNAKFQGPTSRISEDEASSQFHVVNGEGAVSQREAFKILKALDKDVYMDFEHRKYRRSGTHASLGQPDNPRVHFLKVKVTNKE